ncbi:peptidase M23 [Desulfonema ishimotonii]|uniref:Peptidase M23 n=1 Tax=Desulfonema ishimotonii TaxID=45657 RepID=A0A401FSE4_9BACT|nr:peptidoglycan DD-metalloendopeptidase family protein [Desulfonema ishimotonii]GBC59873.1 peptidase M23 [Desulfonema ishimotonii]
MKMKIHVINRYICILNLTLLFWTGCAVASQRLAEPERSVSEYGIDCEVLDVRKDVIKRSENLAGILLREGVSYSKISEAVARCEDVFDVRKIRTGNSYCVITTPGEAECASYFVYEKNPVDYVVFELGEQVRVYKDSKPVEKNIRTAEGRIESSLLGAFSGQGLDYGLAVRMAEIYAWTLDFYHFQKGDIFKILYEEESVDGQPVGCGRILAARIIHRGEDYYAFYFKAEDESVGAYYDENGKSLRKAFLKAPLKYVRISSRYSRKRLHPILQQYKPHLGIDYAAPRGTPIMSVGDGIVEKVAFNKGAGRYVQIRHNRRYMTQYLHMSRVADGVRSGKRVGQGEVIGYVGSTGLATGPHLDFRFWADGEAVNFLKQDIPTADPVDSAWTDRFYAQISGWKTDLDRDDIGNFLAEKMAIPAIPFENSTEYLLFSDVIFR